MPLGASLPWERRRPRRPSRKLIACAQRFTRPFLRFPHFRISHLRSLLCPWVQLSALTSRLLPSQGEVSAQRRRRGYLPSRLRRAPQVCSFTCPTGTRVSHPSRRSEQTFGLPPTHFIHSPSAGLRSIFALSCSVSPQVSVLLPQPSGPSHLRSLSPQLS